MKKQLLILFAITMFFSSCYKANEDDQPITIRLENHTGKEIAAATFFSVLPGNRNQFEYTNIGVNGLSAYILQSETNFSKSFIIDYADGTSTSVDHPWSGNDFARIKPDAGRYTYKLVALNGNPDHLIVQSHRD
jgi:hypothetical protein